MINFSPSWWTQNFELHLSFNLWNIALPCKTKANIFKTSQLTKNNLWYAFRTFQVVELVYLWSLPSFFECKFIFHPYQPQFQYAFYPQRLWVYLPHLCSNVQKHIHDTQLMNSVIYKHITFPWESQYY